MKVGCNYWASHAGVRMWSQWNETVVRQDFERMAERIGAVMTPVMREMILRLKYETPDTEKIMGVEYYRAVIEGGVRTYEQLLQWRSLHPVEGVMHWIP